MTHHLHTWPSIFENIRSGDQPFDIRSDLRIQRGDILIHREIFPCTTCRGSGEDATGHEACVECEGRRGHYSGRTLNTLVTCVSTFKQRFGTQVLGLDIIDESNA